MWGWCGVGVDVFEKRRWNLDSLVGKHLKELIGAFGVCCCGLSVSLEMMCEF